MNICNSDNHGYKLEFLNINKPEFFLNEFFYLLIDINLFFILFI